MKTLSSHWIFDIYGVYERVLEGSRSWLLLAIRLTWGGLFAQAGWGKWHDIPQVTGFFTELGIPLPWLNAYVVATTELAGGVLLLLGLGARIVPLPLIFAMIVAYVTSEQDALKSLAGGDADAFFAAAPFLFLFASLLVLVFGPGVFSLDHVLARRFGFLKKSGE